MRSLFAARPAERLALLGGVFSVLSRELVADVEVLLLVSFTVEVVDGELLVDIAPPWVDDGEASEPAVCAVLPEVAPEVVAPCVPLPAEVLPGVPEEDCA